MRPCSNLGYNAGIFTNALSRTIKMVSHNILDSNLPTPAVYKQQGLTLEPNSLDDSYPNNINNSMADISSVKANSRLESQKIPRIL
jgi:hypothetical protein